MSSLPPLSPDTQQLSNDVTAIFVLNSAYLVFFMHCGFAMVSLLEKALLLIYLFYLSCGSFVIFNTVESHPAE